MKNQFIITESERERILSLHQHSTKKQYLNVISEQQQFYKGSDGKVGMLQGPQVLPAGATKITQQEYDTAMKTQAPQGSTTGTTSGATTGTTTDSTWLKFPGDKNYEYIKKDNKWFTRKVGTTKEFDLSSNPKYKTTVDRLNKQFPDGKTPSGEVQTSGSTQTSGEVQTSGSTQTSGGTDANLSNGITTIIQQLIQNPQTKVLVDNLKSANVDLTKLPPEQILPKIQELGGDVLQKFPTLINSIKEKFQSLTNIKLPDLGQPQTNTQDLSNAPEQKASDVAREF